MSTVIAAQKQIKLEGAPTYLFNNVTNSSEHLDYVAEVMKKQLTPLYGDQEAAIQKIRSAKDRRCYLLYENQTPVGLLVYKKALSGEFNKYNVRNSLEVKSLFVIDPDKNSGRGIGSRLLQKVKEIAKEAFANSLHLTVSETKKDSLSFFQKKGFSIEKVWKDAYQKGTKEYLLSYRISNSYQKQQGSKKMEMPQYKRQKVESAQSFKPKQYSRTHKFPLKYPYINYIKKGQKTIEGRIHSGGFLRVKEGDFIKFFCHRGEVWTRVTEKHTFTDFRKMLEKTGVSNCLPEETDINKAVALYHSFPGYRRKEGIYGVTALKITVVDGPDKEAFKSEKTHSKRGYRESDLRRRDKYSSRSYKSEERPKKRQKLNNGN